MMVAGPVAPATPAESRARVAGLTVHPDTPVPVHTAARLNVPAAREVLAIVNAWVSAGLLGATCTVVPFGLTVAVGVTVVIVQVPESLPPPGVKGDSVIESCTLPVPAAPTEKVAVTVRVVPKAISPTVGQVVIVTVPVPVHVRV